MCFFSNQKSRFGQILEGPRLENLDVCNVWLFGIFYRHLGGFITIWYISLPRKLWQPCSSLPMISFISMPCINPACLAVRRQRCRAAFATVLARAPQNAGASADGLLQSTRTGRTQLASRNIDSAVRLDSTIWDRCYDFANVFAEKFGKKLAFSLQFAGCPNVVICITLVFKENAIFFAEN
jgi:hypothetical protein